VRSLAMLSVVVVGTLACWGGAPDPVDPPTGAAVVAGEETRFVSASTLNLRVVPGGSVVGKLEINSPVVLLERAGEHVRVRAANGREGFVPEAFLSSERLTVERALAAFEASSDAEERLSWMQRAAALDASNRDVLASLAFAYRAVGQGDVADRVERLLSWPEAIHLAGAHEAPDAGRLALEWSTYYPDTYDEEIGSIGFEAAKTLGVTLGAEVWVLPTRSPALLGKVVDVVRRPFNECGGSWGYVLFVEAELPRDETAVAYTFDAPPASWSEPAPARDLESAVAAARALVGPRGFQAVPAHAAPSGAGVRVRFARELPAGDEEIPTFHLVDVDVDPHGTATLRSENAEYMSYIGYDYPTTGRDVDGDGAIDRLHEGLCQQTLYDASDVERAHTEGLCCGC
jgi:hypothetical protein